MRYYCLLALCMFFLIQFCNAQSKQNITLNTDFDFFTGSLKSEESNQVNEKGAFYLIKRDNSNCLQIFRKIAVERKIYTDNFKTFCFNKGYQAFTTNKIKIKFLTYQDSGLVVNNKIYRSRTSYYYGRDIYNVENTIFELVDSLNVIVKKWLYNKGVDSLNENTTLSNFDKWENASSKVVPHIFHYSNIKGFWEIKYCEGISQTECDLHKKDLKVIASLFWLVAFR